MTGLAECTADPSSSSTICGFQVHFHVWIERWYVVRRLMSPEDFIKNGPRSSGPFLAVHPEITLRWFEASLQLPVLQITFLNAREGL